MASTFRLSTLASDGRTWATWTETTAPKTTVLPSTDSESESSHSKAAAASATPGTSTATDGARSTVAASNSLRPGWWPSLVASMVSTTSSVTR
jgi:hypothetical protein